MTREEQYLLQILRDFAHDAESKMPEEPFDWSAFAETATHHSVGGIAYKQCRSVLKENGSVRARLLKAFSGDVFFFTCRTADYSVIHQAFAASGISHIPMKGMLIAGAYPVPALRSMGDIDLIIHHEDREKSHEIMKSLGCQFFVDNHAVWTYKHDVIQYEIHDHMMYDPLANDYDYKAYFDHVWEHVRENEAGSLTIEPSFHFLYVMTHLAKHVINAGMGLRAFLDLVFLVRNEELDWAWITAELRELRLLDFTKVCFALCERWFDVKMPIDSEQLSSRFYEAVMDKIFRDGTFGLENEDNEIGRITRTVKQSDMPYGVSAAKHIWGKIFPPYRDMRLIPWYSFVDGRPWLLPIAWVYRWGYCAKHKLQHTIKQLIQPIKSRRAVRERQKYLNQWGL